jgi:hypothetical protein
MDRNQELPRGKENKFKLNVDGKSEKNDKLCTLATHPYTNYIKTRIGLVAIANVVPLEGKREFCPPIAIAASSDADLVESFFRCI